MYLNEEVSSLKNKTKKEKDRGQETEKYKEV